MHETMLLTVPAMLATASVAAAQAEQRAFARLFVTRKARNTAKAEK